MIPNKEILASLIEGSPYPIYLILGDELIVAVANAATLTAWGKDKSVIGKTFAEAIPELKDQPFEGLLRQVMQTKEAYYAVNDRATLIIDGEIKVAYFTFSYQPLIDENGISLGVLCYATDVTGLVNSIEQVKELSHQAVLANEQLAAINVELEASNAELATANDELTNSYHLLELSEMRFRNLILQAPFSICVIRAKDLIVTDVNDRYLILVGKTREQLDMQSIWEAIPEAAEAYAPVMQEVIASGKEYSAKEAEIPLIRNGLIEQVFVDFTFEPVIDLEGNVSSIMVVGIDVSEKVNARKAIEEIEERIRLAVDAADIGTFEYRMDTDSLVTSPRFDKILGLESGAMREDILNRYHPEDMKLSAQAYEEARTTGKIFYEARLLGEDQSIKWLRYQAKVHFDSKGNMQRTLGTVIDITEYKALQQQKDDFISIASHELKTPITSLKASLQLLVRMRENPNPELFPKLLRQATRSMDKISELVDDLLNVSKMNQGQVALKKDKFKVAEMLEKCCSHFRESLTPKLELKGNLDLVVYADEHRIEQVVVNFVSNALKYAPESKHIFLEVQTQDQFVNISVSDSGPGIPKQNLPHLFDRYYRADDSGKQVSGLGLGLYICADIVHRHGGQIGVESEIGMGSRFWFTLPLMNDI